MIAAAAANGTIPCKKQMNPRPRWSAQPLSVDVDRLCAALPVEIALLEMRLRARWLHRLAAPARKRSLKERAAPRMHYKFCQIRGKEPGRTEFAIIPECGVFRCT